MLKNPAAIQIDARVIELISGGKTIQEACAEANVPVATFTQRMSKVPELFTAFINARAAAQVIKLDDCHRIMTEEPDIARAKLQVDFRRWEASKYSPTIFGDRIDVNVNNKIDLSSILNPAEHRLLLSRRSTEKVIDAEIVDSTPRKLESAAGSEPVESPQVIDPLGILE